MTRPLIALAMIVKNEAHGLADTLESFLPFVDAALILDTGSTDGTQHVAQVALDKHASTLDAHLRWTDVREEPFVDFATTRNRALDLVGGVMSTSPGALPPAYIIMPDADDILHGGTALREYLSSVEAQHAERPGALHRDPCYLVNLRRGHLDYYLPLVMHTDAKPRYRGRVHECLDALAFQRIPFVWLSQAPRAQSLIATTERWKRDRKLLAQDLADDPNNARAAFYLAQTLDGLGDLAGALRAYEHRIKIPPEHTWPDETFEAMYRRAKLLKTIGRPWNDVMRALLDAHAFDPRRAEPLYVIADHYASTDCHSLAYLFASRAAAIPVPDTTMFVEKEIYDYKAADLSATHAFYLADKMLGDPGTRASGRMFARAAVKARPRDGRLRTNWAFYAPDVAGAYPSALLSQIDYKPRDPYHPSNPSVIYAPKCRVPYAGIGQAALGWACLVRTTNYRIVNGEYLTPDDNVIYTENVMVELGPDLRTRSACQIVDDFEMPKTTFPVHGWEDCRVFQAGSDLYVSATACDLVDGPKGEGTREMVELKLERKDNHDTGPDGWRFTSATPMRGTWSSEHQKNWMPVSMGGDTQSREYIYRLDPDAIAVQPGHVVTGLGSSAEIGRLRGGSQVIWVPPLNQNDIGLCIVHDVTFPGGRDRIYLHRFAAVEIKNGKQPRLLGLSEPFFFKKRGIEFCAGLAYGPVTRDGVTRDRLVASFSVDDSSAWLVALDPAEVIASLRKDMVI